MKQINESEKRKDDGGERGMNVDIFINGEILELNVPIADLKTTVEQHICDGNQILIREAEERAKKE